ncbi:GNAT family N-acetyltransferase [Kitasatospora griseola]|uniref:GNAT family N-acetyltransferase n=1 Tax=Kitasatospora griseola TaxID=2064 RepID=UPI003436820E
MSTPTMAAPHGLTQDSAPEIVYQSIENAPSRLHEGLAPSGVYAVTAETREGRIVGRLLWDHTDGMVWWVGVDSGWRRQGIATSLWRLAKHRAKTLGWTRPVHSPYLLHDGRAWIASL